jgi:hypothetical protein
MRKPLNWILTASLGLGSAAFLGCERSTNTGTTGGQASNTTNAAATNDGKVINNKEDAARTAGLTTPGDQIGTVDLTKIYGVLGNVVEDSFDKGDFGDLVSNLAAPDQDRIGKAFANQTMADLDGRIDQLNKDFKAKYNSDFGLNDSKVFENWAKVQKNAETGDKNQTYVTVTIPAGHGMPELQVPMVKDNLAFRINAPDEVTGEQLKQSLMTHLTAAGNMKDQWPADKLEAQRALAHHVLMAVMNKPMQK